MILDTIFPEIAPFGLIVRGGFHPDTSDGVPGNPGTLVLIGNAGPAMWEVFAKEHRGGPDPLDAWTRTVLGGVAAKLGATALFPFDGPPYLPFQRWAMRAEAVFPSPIGPLIHPEYGLWHAYRGALAFAEALDLPERGTGRQSLRSLRRQALPDHLPGGRPQAGRLRRPGLRDPYRQRRRPRLPRPRLRRPPRLPGGTRPPLPPAPGPLPHGPLPESQPETRLALFGLLGRRFHHRKH